MLSNLVNHIKMFSVEAIKYLKKLSPKINLNNISIIGDGLETDILRR